MDGQIHHDEAEFDRLLLLLASDPKPGFEDFYEMLTKREFQRLMPVVDEGEHGE